MSAVSRIAVTTTTAMAITATPSMRPIRSTSRCSGVLCVSTRSSSRATLPISVRHPGRRHDRTAPPASDRSAAEDHVHAVAEPDRFHDGRDVLQDGFALAGQRRLGHRQRRRLDQPPVGGDRVALGKQEHVARHELGGENPLLAPVADDAGRRRRHPLQRRYRVLGTSLLHIAEHGVGDDDRGDDDRIERRFLPALQHPRDQ